GAGLRGSPGVFSMARRRGIVSLRRRLSGGPRRPGNGGRAEAPVGRCQGAPSARRERIEEHTRTPYLRAPGTGADWDFGGGRTMRILAFGSSITSSYWNGAATYYRGMYRHLHALGHHITFAEPDAYGRQQKRDAGDFSYVQSIVYRDDREI